MKSKLIEYLMFLINSTIYHNIINLISFLHSKILNFFFFFCSSIDTQRKISQLNYGESPAAKSPGIPPKKKLNRKLNLFIIFTVEKLMNHTVKNIEFPVKSKL